MMYSNKFIVSLKVGGKILRENSGTVSLPFGSEYGILLKNLNSRRAVVEVSVDGQDATDGVRLILEPNESLELERFIKNGNRKSGNRFKFIERTSDIEEHRGIKEDDGLIRAEFWLEKEIIDVPVVRKHYYDEWYPAPRPWNVPYYPYYPYPIPWLQPQITYTCAGSLGQAKGGLGEGSVNGGLLRSCRSLQGAQSSTGNFQGGQSSQNVMAMNCAIQPSDAGITVPGSLSNQEFQSSSGFETESNSHVIVLQLKGEIGGKPVSKPITVEQKPVCLTCGKTNAATDKFCGKCGTSLVWV